MFFIINFNASKFAEKNNKTVKQSITNYQPAESEATLSTVWFHDRWGEAHNKTHIVMNIFSPNVIKNLPAAAYVLSHSSFSQEAGR